MTFDTDAINNIKFTQGFRGYDTVEVDEFLDDMIREIEKLNGTIKNLKDELGKEKRKSMLSQQEIERLTEINESFSAGNVAKVLEEPIKIKEPSKPAEEPETVKIKQPTSMEDIKGTPEYEEMKQVLTDTLLNAQQHAEELVKSAKERAGRVVEEGERKAKDRIVALKSEIDHNQEKLNSVLKMVVDARQRFKKNFQDQITALDNIFIDDIPERESIKEKPVAEEPVYVPEKQEPIEEIIEVPELLPLDDIITEKIEEKQAEKPTVKSDDASGVSTFDFAAIKKSLSKDGVQEEPAASRHLGAQMPDKPSVAAPAVGSSEIEDDNKQYIEVAMSAYNENKHHNTDYPTPPKNIKINEDGEDGGIYQPENRSVLSSVIEEILNNKRKDD